MKSTPYFELHKAKLDTNLKKLQALEASANIHILHTLKSFNQASVLPLMASKLSGMSISSVSELQMAKNAKAKHIHLYAPAFKVQELEEMLKSISTLSLNSLSQWKRFKSLNVSKGLRINPKLDLSIPTHCNSNLSSSRLGVDFKEFLEIFKKDEELFLELEGLHFHALFQSSVEDLEILLKHISHNFQELLPKLKWLNLGGGHDFTNVDYDVNILVKLIDTLSQSYPKLKIYFEPGETITKGCGDFVTTVLDIVKIDKLNVVILDTSVETHLLDVAIVQQRLKVRNTQEKATPYLYELTGNSCLQGDTMGKYFFTKALQIGDEVVFEDMMPYTMVKMTEFNGMERAKFYLE